MARRPKSYLRTERLRHALSQRELGLLVGLCKDAISKYELDQRPISASLVVASEIIFGKTAAELFPAFYQKVQERIGRGAARLSNRVEGRKDAASRKKQKLIARIPERTITFDP